MGYLFKNADGSPSITATAFTVGFMICSFKPLISGVVIKGITLGAFSGGDFAVAIAALGGVYVLRRNINNGQNGSSS